jgi:osmotically inducible protein OsmC
MKRSASIIWQGDLKQGKGMLATQSGALKDMPYSFSTRFENGLGTNPEELIAAAFGGCFTMALSAFLGKAGFIPKKLMTEAHVAMEQVQGNWAITGIELSVTGQVEGITQERFIEVANEAKANCPVGKILNTKVTLNVDLV